MACLSFGMVKKEKRSPDSAGCATSAGRPSRRSRLDLDAGADADSDAEAGL